MTAFKGKHIKGATVINSKTGEVIEENHGEVFLMGPKPGVCQQCAVDHKPSDPHNAQSLAYQYWFYNETGRWPTWLNAMAHCSDEMKAAWRQRLIECGVNVDAGEINPRKKP